MPLLPIAHQLRQRPVSAAAGALRLVPVVNMALGLRVDHASNRPGPLLLRLLLRLLLLLHGLGRRRMHRVGGVRRRLVQRVVHGAGAVPSVLHSTVRRRAARARLCGEGRSAGVCFMVGLEVQVRRSEVAVAGVRHRGDVGHRGGRLPGLRGVRRRVVVLMRRRGERLPGLLLLLAARAGRHGCRRPGVVVAAAHGGVLLLLLRVRLVLVVLVRHVALQRGAVVVRSTIGTRAAGEVVRPACCAVGLHAVAVSTGAGVHAGQAAESRALVLLLVRLVLRLLLLLRGGRLPVAPEPAHAPEHQRRALRQDRPQCAGGDGQDEQRHRHLCSIVETDRLRVSIPYTKHAGLISIRCTCGLARPHFPSAGQCLAGSPPYLP